MNKKQKSYFNTIRILRNACAHGGCVYDIKLKHPILSGPAKTFVNNDASNINAAIQVTRYVLGKVSNNRMLDFENAIKDLLSVNRPLNVANIIAECTGLEQ